MSENTYADFFRSIVGRSEIAIMPDAELLSTFQDKKVLIIGAGGTIGSSIAEKLVGLGVTGVFITDRDESALHGLALRTYSILPTISKNSFVADIRDKQSLHEVFSAVQPDIVFHAAALKHLPVLEKSPREGFFANIIGTLNVTKLCLEFRVAQLVNISTDKAAFPVSILGKTKKIAEHLVEEISQNTKLIQCSVRFGNVFASRGSVIETFNYQIRNEMDVTITDPKVTRYFMSRNEAAELVLVAAALKESGTFIQEMGSQVAIVEIVTRMANHLGKKPSIVFTGLSQGEKLHEELFDGPSIQTKYPQILQSKHEIRTGLVKDIESSIPESNLSARVLIERLYQTYIA